MPPPAITSAEELSAVAHALEGEAGRRYRELAARMRIQGQGDLAQLFTFLASLEDKHARQVLERTQAMIGKEPATAEHVRWELPENFDEEDARSSTLTPYRALATAIRNEERAFAFYAYAAAAAQSDAVRRFAEEFAKDELDHAGLLRRERRKAWRRERKAGELPLTLRPESVTELLAQAAPLERATAAAHRQLAGKLSADRAPDAAALFAHAAEDESALAEALEGRIPPGAAAAAAPVTANSVRDGLRLLEYAFERYTDIAETTQDEGVMQEAQKLAEHALRRLAYVHGRMDRALLEGA